MAIAFLKLTQSLTRATNDMRIFMASGITKPERGERFELVFYQWTCGEENSESAQMPKWKEGGGGRV